MEDGVDFCFLLLKKKIECVIIEIINPMKFERLSDELSGKISTLA